MASTYTMVAYGSQGSAVKQLQSELNRRGYGLDEDGIFGKKTRAAVRDYQKKNGLRCMTGSPGARRSSTIRRRTRTISGTRSCTPPGVRRPWRIRWARRRR